jgi:hypothetical protein
VPKAQIAGKQALYALAKLHSELAGKLIDSKAESRRLTVCMMQVEAVMKMLALGFSVATIAVRRRKPNPWFKRGTVYRAAQDVLRVAPKPMTAREIAEATLAATKSCGAQRFEAACHRGNDIGATSYGSRAFGPDASACFCCERTLRLNSSRVQTGALQRWHRIGASFLRKGGYSTAGDPHSKQEKSGCRFKRVGSAIPTSALVLNVATQTVAAGDTARRTAFNMQLKVT